MELQHHKATPRKHYQKRCGCGGSGSREPGLDLVRLELLDLQALYEVLDTEVVQEPPVHSAQVALLEGLRQGFT